MPRVKIDYVVSFSSEDPNNPANNLLASEVNKKKWLCSKGEPSCSVVLQLTKAVKINAIHIGVHHTALVEVLVGLSEKPNDPYQVLVPSSIFLSPIDSRRGEGIERVRSFSDEQLVAETRTKKWDRVRVVCSQPYNKHCKYGLSFIHIYEPESKDDPKPMEAEKNPTTADKTAGVPEKATAVPDRLLNLNVDTFSSDEDEFKPGELFRRHQMGNTETQIRQASSQALKNIDDASTKLMKTPLSKTKQSQPDSHAKKQTNKNTDKHTTDNTDRQRNSLIYTEDDEQPHSKIDHVVNRHKDEKAKRDEEKKKQEEKLAKQKEEQRKEKREKRDERRNDDRTSQGDAGNYKKIDDRTPQKKDKGESSGGKIEEVKNKHTTPQIKKTRDDRTSQDQRKDRKRSHSSEKKKNRLRPGPVSESPHTLLSNVVFVLSGYENPRRSSIRDAAIAMGARFERDWGSRCTHLICAFPNTPKLKTVRSSPNGKNAIVVTGEWIERCCERRRLLPWQWFATEPAYRVQHDTDDEVEPDDPVSEDEQPKSPPATKKQRNESFPPPKKRSFLCSDDENDGEETKKISQRVSPPVVKVDSPQSESRDSLDDDGNLTDADETQSKVEIDKERVLPDFFDGYTFSMDPTLARTFDCNLLSRYVRAYGGLVLENCQIDDDSSVDYYLCADDTECIRAKTRVRADWVWRCHREKRLASPEPYVF